MSLTKVNYIDNETIITAANLNNIQDEIINNKNNIDNNLEIVNNSINDKINIVNNSINNNLNLIKKVGNPKNLLDNSDFRNPVNQRSEVIFTDPVGYTIDRWQLNYGTIEINDGNITIAHTNTNGQATDFEQNIEIFNRLQGKICTIAVKTNEGLFVKTFIMGDCGDGIILIDNKLQLFSTLDRHVILRINDINGINFEWIALYEGEYTTETLPEYQPKGYAAELAECQRYYYPFKYSVGGFSGYIYGTTIARCCLILPLAMRTTPTLTIEDISEITIFPGAKAATNVELFMSVDKKLATLSFTTSGLTSSVPCFIRLNSAQIALNADL